VLAWLCVAEARQAHLAGRIVAAEGCSGTYAFHLDGKTYRDQMTSFGARGCRRRRVERHPRAPSWPQWASLLGQHRHAPGIVALIALVFVTVIGTAITHRASGRHKKAGAPPTRRAGGAASDAMRRRGC